MKVFQVLLIAAVLFKQSTGAPVIASEEGDIESIVAREEHAHTDTETFTLEERDVQAHKRDCGCKWCQHKDKYLSGYCTGCSCRDRLGYKFDTLDEAKAAFCKCSCSRKCGGITYEPFSKKYTLRKGSTPLDAVEPGRISWVCSKEDDKDEEEEGKHDEDCGCKWCQHKEKYLSGYCIGCSCRDRLGYKFDTLDEAKAAFCKCSCSRKCGGITYEPFSKKYTLRKGSTPLDGGYPGVISWVCSKDDKNKDEDDKDEEDKDEEDKDEKDKDEKDKDGEEDKKKDKKDKKKKDKKDKKKKDKKDKKKKKKKDKGQLLE